MRVPIERILCPVDFSEFSVAAYRYATSLAQHYSAQLLAFHVVEAWKHPSACFAATADDYERFWNGLTKDATEELSHFVESYSPLAVHPELEVQAGIATDRILSCAESRAISLIVIGTHGVRGFDKVMLGSVTEKVLRKSTCSVLAVHRSVQMQPSGPDQPIQLREILFGTDFSKYSDRALDYALSVAGEYRAHLTVVHVIDGISRLNVEHATREANDQLSRLISSRAGRGCAITPVLRSGRAYREINALACENHADLVIMAVHGRNALDRSAFGSTTYRVVCLRNTPVLAVHG